MKLSTPSAHPRGNGWLWLTLGLGAVLVLLFYKSFAPGQAMFANDGPLGVQKIKSYAVPDALFGIWNELGWLGGDNGAIPPNLRGLMLFLGPLGYLNFSVPLSLLILGWCAWFYFRQLGFRPMVCALGGLAAALNMNFFSNACWGLPSRATCLAMIFLALAALHSGLKSHGWIKAILAGLAIGLSISEGGDNGAFFSLFVAAYAFWIALTGEGGWLKKSIFGALRVAVMAVFATVLATQMLEIFLNTAVTGVVGTAQDQQTKEQRWDFATQWSLPKAETLRVIIPGLYGYRMDTPDGGNYWGRVGEAPGAPEQLRRHSGAGEYAGVLVVLVACWALAGAASRRDKIFSPLERKMIWFWGAMAVIALLFSWGRHAPFYQIIYALPYLSTIRNPMKFMHPFHLCLMVLFAYGLAGLSRRYLETAAAKTLGLGGQLKKWWAGATAFEKLWNYGCGAVIGLSVLAWLVYTSAHRELAAHLGQSGFDADLAGRIATFSAGEVGIFVLILMICAALLLLVQGGVFAGGKARWAGLLLGLVLVADLSRADLPWIKYYNYREKYATNPVVDFLAQHSEEARVMMPRFQISQNFSQFQQFYHVEWLQHHFPFYSIRAMDAAQEPRVPADKQAYLGTVGTNIMRYWQLTNTRYVFGVAPGFVEQLNQQLDPVEKRFRLHTAFAMTPKPGVARATTYDEITVAETKDGPLALIEFSGALPRAQLYPHWQSVTNDETALHRLADPAFNPAQSVLVADVLPASTNTGAALPVEASSYAPREIRFQTSATVPTVLLLNERFDPRWQVTVDGAVQKTLRCNFLMRGVQVPAGHHQVVFRYQQSATTFYISVVAEGFGLLLCGFLFTTRARPGHDLAPNVQR